jgi:hypothetical protein
MRLKGLRSVRRIDAPQPLIFLSGGVVAPVDLSQWDERGKC